MTANLRTLFGAKLLAYVVGAKSTRTAQSWIDGTATLDSATRHRLELAYQIVVLASRRDSIQTVQAWFQGMNPMLGDRSPARVLRECELGSVDANQLIAAANEFGSSG
ncbi:hypothetical protein Y710_03940 [Gordonia sp. QH-12]|nr:hypothetical protein Y710_03940 [Gordonia sp. QH-12]